MASHPPAILPDTTHIGHVHLRVADRTRALAFYQDMLGYQSHELDGGAIRLVPHAGEPAHFVLTEQPGVHPKPWRTAGLFHAAIRLPQRGDLARVLHHLSSQQWRLSGMSDHGVSEALYLNDPDGNGLEIYVDRPRDQWPWRSGELAMVSAPIDLSGLMAELEAGPSPWNGVPSGSDIGHIHLQVSDLQRSEAFYGQILGFQTMQRTYAGALFVSAGGYHHHLGLNVWAGEGVPAMPDNAAGLIAYSLILPDHAALEEIRVRATDAGLPVVDHADQSVKVRDPDGNMVELRIESQ